MSASLPATYFDGDSLREHAVTLGTTEHGELHAVGEGVDLRIAAADVRVSERLGHVPFFLRLPDRGVLELPCNDAAAAMLEALRPPGKLSTLIHRLESHSAIAATATLLLVFTVAVTLWQGLPRLALHIAYAVPVSIETEAGKAGSAYFSRAYPRSLLTRNERQPVYNALDRLKKARVLHVEPTLLFFHMPMANAFALPGGIIVVTDDIVRLADGEDEIAAVIAHELGHVENRHGLQSVLRNSSALIVVSTVTGDLSTLSTFSGTLPFLLLEYGYSREFEREADVFAVGLLREAHIDPFNLAVMLQKLEKARPTSGPDFSYLSTHPATGDRIKFVESFRLPPGDPHAFVAKPSPLPTSTGKNLASNSSHAPTTPLSADNDDDVQAEITADSTTSTTQIEGGNSVRSSAPDSMPYPILQPSPTYPESLRRSGVSGEVLVDFIVDTHGNVQNAYVIRSTNPGLEPPALEAVRRWKFQPGVKDSRAVNVHMQVPVGFRLTDQ